MNMTFFRQLTLFLLCIIAFAGCPQSGGSISQEDAEKVSQDIAAIIEQDPRLSGTTALDLDDYEQLAQKFAGVKNVEYAEFAKDTLGSIHIQVAGGGFLLWRHIKNTYTEAATLPAGLDLASLIDPTWNSGWSAPAEPGEFADTTSPQTGDRSLQGNESNGHATHFPVALDNPDPEYAADDAVTCQQQGKIAIVDFQWSDAWKDAPGLYEDQFQVDGMMLYDRLKAMAEAAGFTLDLFKDTDINTTNFDKLSQYSIVYIIGHGGRPPLKSSRRLGALFTYIATPETYEPQKQMVGGITHEEAWKKGYIIYDPVGKRLDMTSLLFRDLYKTRANVPQLWMPNSCWSMLPYNVGIEKKPDGTYGWMQNSQDVTGKVYNIGHGLMAAGVKAVFGYVTPASPEAIVKFSIRFFRRMFGGYYKKDPPPWPHTYWPTCMSSQTFFRNPANPWAANYCPLLYGHSLYTMYTIDDPLFLRQECTENANDHALMQSFMLKVGTPATAFDSCWSTWWSGSDCPSGIDDALCSQGDCPTTQQASNDAACAVKVARKVTNAMLR